MNWNEYMPKKIRGRLAAHSGPNTKLKKMSEGQSVNVNSVSQIQWRGTYEYTIILILICLFQLV